MALDLPALLETKRREQGDVVRRINILTTEIQVLTQEALRLDGEIRLLTQLSQNGTGSGDG